MKTECSFMMNEDGTESLVPPQMIRAGSTLVRSFADIMLMYGVDKIEMNIQHHGRMMLGLPKIRTIEALEGKIPEWVATTRKHAMLKLGEIMMMYGFRGLDLIMEEFERKAVVDRWTSCGDLSGGARPPDDLAELIGPDGELEVEEVKG